MLSGFGFQLSLAVACSLGLFFMAVSLVGIVGCPHALNAQLEGPRDAVCQADADALDLLAQHFGLGLDDEAVVGTDKVVPLDEYRLPLARPLCEQTVLVQVRGHHRLGLHIDKVRPPVRLDPQGQVRVHIDVPDGAPKHRRGPVDRPPRREPGSLDVRAVRGQRRRDATVEARVRGRGSVLSRLGGAVGGGFFLLLRRRNPVQRRLGVAADVHVAHELAVSHVVRAVERV